MAYGMITSGILGAVAGLGEAAIKKVGDINEAELKAKIDAEKEKRIEEAQIRQEGRAAEREQTIYDRNQSQEAINKATEHQNRIDEFAAQERIRQANAGRSKTAELTAEQQFIEQYPDSPAAQRIKLQNEQTTATTQASKASTAVSQLEIKSKQRIMDAQDNVISAMHNLDSAKTPEEKLAAQAELNSAEKTFREYAGKNDPTFSIQKESRVIGYDDKGKPMVVEKLYWADPRNRQLIPAVTGSVIPLTEQEIENKASAYALSTANLDHIPRHKTFGGDSDEDIKKYNDAYNTKKSELEAFNETAKLDNQQQETQRPTGMLNKSTANTDDLNSLYNDKVNIGGMRKVGSKEFEPSQGVDKDLRKMDHQLWLYGTGESKNIDKPITTLRETISTWSPKNDNNDTERLINDASKLLNIKPDDKIDLTDSATRGQLMKALIKQEHGGQIKGDINKIYQYIDDTYGSTPLIPQSNLSKKIINITKEK